jgi:ATP-dependent Lhr-like helicase
MPDLDLALKILMGNTSQTNTLIVRGQISKKLTIESLLPDSLTRFPTTSHLGLDLLPKLIILLEQAQSTLIYTNTRAFAELWYQAILEMKPEWAGLIAVHHSSLANNVRQWVEEGLRSGQLRCVVCTSSMDLGVDFSPVELTVQIGTPKNISRLLQRAGRSGHQPYSMSRLICVPTNALELLDIAAVKKAISENKLESFIHIEKPLDVLIQHLVSMSLGEGFNADELFAEMHNTYSYRNLTISEWSWALNFVCNGGTVLNAYPNYHKIKKIENSFVISNKKIALHHRLTMGTIISEAEIPVRYLRGPYIGQVDENFIARLRPHDCFILSGKMLEFVRLNNNIAYVRKALKPTLLVPRWQGQRLSLSHTFSEYICKLLIEAENGDSKSSEISFLKPLFDIQKKWSKIPTGQRLLIENIKSRDGYHLFIYPLMGRSVNEGLAALCAYRLTQQRPITISIAANDYGFELLCSAPVELTDEFFYKLFKLENLMNDLIVSINLGELAKRHFKEIAHIAGLIFKGYPSKAKSNKQLQVSSNLLYDVFTKFDPENLLLKQAWQEVLTSKLEYSRLLDAIIHIRHNPLDIIKTSYFTPFAFPLMVDRLRHRLSSESLAERVQRMTEKLENAACKI